MKRKNATKSPVARKLNKNEHIFHQPYPFKQKEIIQRIY